MIFSTGNSSLSSILLSIFVVSMYNITVANALLLRSGRTSGLFALRYGSTLKKTSSACTRILSPYSSVSSLNIISSARSVNGYRTPRESLCCGLDVYGRQSSTLAASEKDDSHTSKRVGVGSIKHTTTNSTFYDLSGTPAALSGLPDFSRPFTVLGIETSCDDTGVAIVRSDGKILSNIVMSQVLLCLYLCTHLVTVPHALYYTSLFMFTFPLSAQDPRGVGRRGAQPGHAGAQEEHRRGRGRRPQSRGTPERRGSRCDISHARPGPRGLPSSGNQKSAGAIHSFTCRSSFASNC